jgi:hypothetical protein
MPNLLVDQRRVRQWHEMREEVVQIGEIVAARQKPVREIPSLGDAYNRERAAEQIRGDPACQNYGTNFV